MRWHVERVRAAASALLAGDGERRRWRAELGRWPDLGPFVACLESPPRTMPTSSELAGLVHADERSFRRHVRAAIGLTPVEALASSKLARAARRLRDTEDAATTIAGREGFASLAAFDHAFVRYLESTPSTFRQRTPQVADFVGPPPGRTDGMRGAEVSNSINVLSNSINSNGHLDVRDLTNSREVRRSVEGG